MNAMVLRTATMAATLLVAVISGCNQPQPTVSEQTLRALRDEMPGVTAECLNKVKFGAIEAMPEEVDQCFEMLPQQRWRGLWRRGFEVSRFCPVPVQTCAGNDAGESIWLDEGDHHLDRNKPLSSLQAVEFIGRRTRARGHYAHLGMYDHEVVVDQWIAIKPVDEAAPLVR